MSRSPVAVASQTQTSLEPNVNSSSTPTRSLRSATSTAHPSSLASSSSLATKVFPRYSGRSSVASAHVLTPGTPQEHTSVRDGQRGGKSDGGTRAPPAGSLPLPVFVQRTGEGQPNNGKGKEREYEAETSAAPSRAETPDGRDGDKKRVQPSRSSRRNVHALGLGTSAIDLMILDSHQRAAANKPLLPHSTVFFLTTDSSLVPPLAEGTSLNFSRSVASCSKKGEAIPTPEFWPLPAAETVSTRLRARGGDEEAADTSDAAYMARHRRYETLEKRQRTQEKEKLVHERYKLKERLEQLRALSTGASLALADADDKKMLKDMLKEAELLERRYDLLLPTESRKKKGELGAGLGDSDGHPSPRMLATPTHSFKLKFKVPPKRLQALSIQDDDGGDDGDPGSGNEEEHYDDEDDLFLLDDTELSHPENPLRHPHHHPHHRQTHRDHSGRFASSSASKSRAATSPSSTSSPSKRVRLSMASTYDPDLSSSSSRRAVPVILQAAQRAVAEPNAKRKTPRHALAFGLKVPLVVDEVRDFELPDWRLLRERYHDLEDSAAMNDIEQLYS